MTQSFIAQVQRDLTARGYDVGLPDGVAGPRTEAAWRAMVATMPATQIPTPAASTGGLKRIILHWSAGTHNVSALDRSHYHYCVAGDGSIVPGIRRPDDNISTTDGAYAAHCLNANTGSIGIALAAMAGATERPFNAGAYPITTPQLDAFCGLAARLAKQYGIPNTRATILTHAEVQPTLGIAQRGKWDICWLPGMAEPQNAIAVGDTIRAMIAAKS